jgi:hypothetical protein
MAQVRRWMGSSMALAVLAVAALASASCYDFHIDGPEDAPPPPLPRVASVTVEYHQPSQCSNVAARCADKVVFYGSWMRPGQEVFLSPVPGRFIWIGTVTGVPVNFPPAGGPHTVRVFDPYLVGSPTGGVSGRRLVVGGETLTQIEDFGTRDEKAQVYVDDNGFGHNAV